MKKITISINQSTFNFIEANRGNKPRSNYISTLIEKEQLLMNKTLIASVKNEISEKDSKDWLNITLKDISNADWNW